MKKVLTLLVVVLATTLVLSAQEAKPQSRKEARRARIARFQQSPDKPTVKLYGFVRNYMSLDTRACKAGTEDLFTHVPMDENWNEDHSVDLNKVTTTRFLALTSRLGVDAAYEIKGFKFAAKIEADFYNKNGSTAIFRLRQAYVTLNKGIFSMKVGQAWHPMAADMVDVFSLNTGAPFAPFSRTPVLLFDFKATENLVATVGAIYQMQYLSQGPNGSSQDYIKHGGFELYAGLSYVGKNFTARVGADVLSIVPRWQGKVGGVTTNVKDRLTTVNPYIFAKYAKDAFSIQAKAVYHQGGEHISLLGGYALLSTDNASKYTYTPTHGITANISTYYKFADGWKAVLLLGYHKNFGLMKEIDFVNLTTFYYNSNGAKNLNSAFRVTPEIVYTIGKFDVGVEYECTGATYGNWATGLKSKGLATEQLRTVANHRVQLMVKFSF
ncbi:MAG: hypothetical protein HUJ95_04525 [Bacteroidales bacterium]|nr:hypothetical protein [Bacteroidales bacterium]